jgi:Inner membrane component of T3SS, cytoplasmic domain
MKTRLQGMHTRGTMTRLFDGLLTAMGGFNGSVPARRELTVISDGHDEGSRSHLEQVVQMARDRGIAIDAIGLTRSSPAYLQTLSTLASETGGSFHQVHNDQELDSLISNGMNRLKATPVATFEAKHISGDGKRHTLGVHWSAGAGLSGETAFVAPKLSGPQVMRSLKHIPPWGYGVLALVCFALLIAVIATIRRMRRRDAVEDVPYALPRQPDLPVPPFGNSEAAGIQRESSFAGEPFPPAGFGRRQIDAEGLKIPGVAPKLRPLEQPVSRNKQTRIAGVFDAAGGSIARLDILTGALSGTSVEVQRGEFWIGAAPVNQFVLSNDATVSSRHAYLIFEDPILILVDNRSTNGTRVNGKMLRGSRQPLHDGDQIQIGQTLLRLRSMA